MSWKWFGGGLAVGVVAGAAFILSRQPKATDTDITFPNKSFHISSYPGETAALTGSRDQLDFSGTISGRGISYPNNVFRAVCIKQEGKCHVSTISQIGSKQIGDLDGDDWDILEWSADYVVARNDDPATTVACYVDIFHANIHSQEVIYTSEPVQRNISNERLCPPKFVGRGPYRWTVEAPKFWKNINASHP